jgi:hypothetical protein
VKNYALRFFAFSKKEPASHGQPRNLPLFGQSALDDNNHRVWRSRRNSASGGESWHRPKYSSVQYATWAIMKNYALGFFAFPEKEPASHVVCRCSGSLSLIVTGVRHRH